MVVGTPLAATDWYAKSTMPLDQRIASKVDCGLPAAQQSEALLHSAMKRVPVESVTVFVHIVLLTGRKRSRANGITKLSSTVLGWAGKTKRVLLSVGLSQPLTLMLIEV